MVNNKKFYTVTELARLMKISRVAVFKKIKKGQIKALKIGRFYIISNSEAEKAVADFFGDNLDAVVEKGVKRAVKEYGEALKLLGKE